MKANPLVGVALAYVAGIILARFATEYLLILPLAATGLLVGSLFSPTVRTLAILAVVLNCGALNYCVRWVLVPPGELRAAGLGKEQLAEVRGRVLERPLVREFRVGNRTNYTTTARLQITALKRKAWESAHGVVLASTRGLLSENIRSGSVVEIAGVLRIPPGARAEGLFDYRQYLVHEGIFFQLRVEGAEDWRAIGPEPQPRWRDSFADWSRKTLSRGVPDDENLRLLLAMTLGWAGALEGEVADPFLRTGTMHIFAISGLHVACIALALAGVVHLVGIGRMWTAWGVLPLIWFYTVATGWQSSGVRAAIMSSVVLLGYSLRRPSALLNSIAVAALILVFQPEQVFHASFQLSFIVVAAMAWLLPSFEQFREAWLAPDPFLPPDLHGWWQRAWRRFLRTMLNGLGVSVAATLGALPLTLWYFNIVTPIGLVANLLAVPLSSISLTASLASLLLSPLAPIFNWIAWGFMVATVAAVRWLADFRWGYSYAEAPGFVTIGLYYTWLTALGLLLARRTPGRCWATVAATLTLVASVVIQSSRARPPTVTVLPGDGGAVWIDLPGVSSDLLLGCSSESNARSLVARFLHARGLDGVPNVLLSHGDIDQAGGFERIWEDFQPATVFTSAARARSPSYRQAVAVLEQNPRRWQRIGRGDQAAGGQVLHPGPDTRQARADDNAIVLQGEIEGWRVLFLSELGERGQLELLDLPLDLKADIVIAGFPSRDEPLPPALLERINPQVIVLTEKSSAGFGVSERRVVERLTGGGYSLRLVSRERAITLSFQRGRCEVRGMTGLARTFAKAERP